MSPATIESPWVDFTIHSTSQQCEEAIEKILVLMRVAGWNEGGDDSPHFFAMRLILEELIVNAIKHGNGMDTERLVYIRHDIDTEKVTVSIEDSGAGFNHQEIADPLLEENLERPSGRGVLLAKSFATDIEFIPLPNDPSLSNHVHIVRHRNHDQIMEQRKAAMVAL